ncbi:MAG: DUF3857 domain-containing protein [Myxococcales bacterium]|nr:DUF3857 domain-containing protein [Myxococcales bacterium]MBK7197491.1 DUF3857 domain-containing protein [Myxococcales bacterium]
MIAVRLAGALLVLLAAGAATADPLDEPAFTASPAALLAAAAQAPGTDDVVVLREDVAFTIGADGGIERRLRRVLLVRRPDADALPLLIPAPHWQPSFQARPVMRVRIIAPDGRVTELPASAITDAPAMIRGPTVRSEARRTEVALPRLAAGAVLEEELTIGERVPVPGAGAVHMLELRGPAPILHSSVVVSRPTATRAVVALRGPSLGAKPREQRVGDRTVTRFEARGLAPGPTVPLAAPADHVAVPVVIVATGASWAAVATAYRAVIEARLDAPLAIPPDLHAATPRATVDRVLAWMQARVEPDGLPFLASGFEPMPPADTAIRTTASIRDRAVLLVAALRAAGLTADVALVTSDEGPDADPATPGLGVFDHMLVRVQLKRQELWLDPAMKYLPAGELRGSIRGRRALILARGTRRLVTTPTVTSASNQVAEHRTYHLTGNPPTVDVTYRTTGMFGRGFREAIATQPTAVLRAGLERAIAGTFDGAIGALTFGNPADLSQPCDITLRVDRPGTVAITDDDATVMLTLGELLNWVDEPLFEAGDAHDQAFAARTVDYVWQTPQRAELTLRLELPPGHLARAVPLTPRRAIGAMTLTTTIAREVDALVVTLRLDSGAPRITAADARATRAALVALRAAPAVALTTTSEIALLVQQGKRREATDRVRAVIARTPGDADAHARLARLYGDVGMGLAARREARTATTLAPTSGRAWVALGAMLERDELGRTFEGGGDRAGAEAAYRKALALDPADADARWGLTQVLAYDDYGRVLAAPARVREAIQILRGLPADDERDRQLTKLLTLLEDGPTLAAHARSLAGATHDEAMVIAAALRDGGAAAVSVAREVAGDASPDPLLQVASDHMVQARRYDDARSLDRAKQRPTGAAWLPLLARFDPAVGTADPRTPVRAWIASVARVPVAAPAWSAAAAQGLAKQLAWEPLPKLFWAAAAVRDMLVAAMVLTVDGDVRLGWRVRLPNGITDSFYVALRGGRATLIGGSRLPGALAGELQAAIAGGALDQARQWLRWYQEDTATDTGARAAWLSRHKAALATMPAEELTLAVALLRIDDAPAAAIPVLDRCPGAATAADRGDCRLAAAIARRYLGDLAGAVADARAAVALEPMRFDAASALATALALSGDRVAAAAALDGPLAASPDDPKLVWARAEIAMADGWAAAALWVDRYLATPTPSTLNTAAWAKTFIEPGAPAARAWVETALLGAIPPGYPLLNTQAVVLAEADQPEAAWEAVRKSIEGRPPGPEDFYPLGRIAEAYGLRDEAITWYRRCTPAPLRSLGPTGWDFAQKRLKALGVTP